jgi:SAM-dependent methyltransferase
MSLGSPKESGGNCFGESSQLVRRFASKIAEASGGLPILDVACGSGRNALPLLQLGCSVICLDRDLTRLRVPDNSSAHALPRLRLCQIDLVKDVWPFGAASVGGIINIHFLLPTLFPSFESSLAAGGYLLFETVSGCGGNYLELPKAGVVRDSLGKGFDFAFYKERKVGPIGYDAVTVRLLARRRSDCNI